jgi:AcrR family transcriptional regulator
MAVTDGPRARGQSASTRERVVDVALSSFAARGFEATSLDDVAAELGVTKQTVLYYHPSKDALLGAVIERGVAELAAVLREAARRGVERGEPLEEVVDALFRIGARRPELLELVRESLRLGPPASTRLIGELSPLVDELAGGVPHEVIYTAAAMVVGMATEVDVLRGLGVEPTRGALRRRRRVLLDYLTDALG